MGKHEGERPLGRPRRRWEDNIKMDFKEIGYKGVDRVNVAQDRYKWRAILMRQLSFGFHKM